MSFRRTSIAVSCVAALTSALLAAGAGPANAEDDAPGCSTGQLPNVVMGSPDVKPGQALGVYLWHGSNGYSLRATHPGHSKVVISGRLSASNGFSHVTKVRLEKADWVKQSSDGKQLTFRFTNYGYIDGINLAADCSRLIRVNIHIDGAAASPRQIKLGKHRSNPTSNPFTIERSKPAQSATPTATIG